MGQIPYCGAGMNADVSPTTDQQRSNPLYGLLLQALCLVVLAIWYRNEAVVSVDSNVSALV